MTSSIPLKTSSLGFPRVGKDRELKFALESFWKGNSSEADLLEVARKLCRDHWLKQRVAGINIIPSNDFSLYDQVLDALVLIGATLHEEGVLEVQIDEPMLVTDLRPWERQAFRTAYKQLAEVPIRVMLTTYFGGIGDNLSLAVDLHIDAVRAPEQIAEVIEALGANQTLSLGIVNGRNIWLTHFAEVQPIILQAIGTLGVDRVIVSTSCSLLHTPHDLNTEQKLNPRIKSWLRFASEKLSELVALASNDAKALEANTAAVLDRAVAESSTNTTVRKRMATLTDQDFARSTRYEERAELQRATLNLPLLPTTTIGSFPQTAEIRQHRAAFKHGHLDRQQYENFLRKATENCIREQERIGLDVLVHGEFERNDMVEYFAEFLEGFTFSENGWVQSYGSRCVKPPVIYGDVSRPKAMTVEWSSYARALTKNPMKGMLTGPITVLQWSFVRDDIPRKDTAWQIALALRDEVQDLEAAGLPIIQVDEPALREGLPLRRSDWAPT